MFVRYDGSVAVTCTGVGIPADELSSERLEERLGLPRGWIQTRTGIASRRIADAEEATSDLAMKAAMDALASGGLTPGQIGLVLLATSTPDHPVPPTAPLVAHRMGCRHAAAFDLAAACSGFIYALATAAQYIQTGACRHALVIGANVMSRRLDWDNPETCALFGDGAGAVVLSAAAADSIKPRLQAAVMHSDGSGYGLLQVPGGGSRLPLDARLLTQKADRIKMKGPLLFRRAVRLMATALEELFARTGLEPKDCDWLLPHQANMRIIEAIARHFAFPLEKVITNIHRYGNTSSASIPIALHEAARSGLILPGQRLALVAFGSGLVSGAALLEWH